LGWLDNLDYVEGFIYTGAVGGKMNIVSPGTTKPKIGQDHKFKIIVCGDKYL